MGHNISKPPSSEEFLAFKDNQHYLTMLSAQKRDEDLAHFPYIEHIPFPSTYITRQSGDIQEAYFMTALVCAPLTGYFSACVVHGGPFAICRS